MGSRGFTPSPLEVALYELVLLAIPSGVELDWAEQHDPDRSSTYAVVYFDLPEGLSAQPDQYVQVNADTGDVEEVIEQTSEVTGYVEFRGDGAYQAAATFRLSRVRSRVRSACLAKKIGWTDTEPPQRLPQPLQKGVRERVRAGLRFEVLEVTRWVTDEWVRESALTLEEPEIDGEGVTLSTVQQTFT